MYLLGLTLVFYHLLSHLLVHVLLKVGNLLHPLIVFRDVSQVGDVDVEDKVVQAVGSVQRPSASGIGEDGVHVSDEVDPRLAHEVRELEKCLGLAGELGRLGVRNAGEGFLHRLVVAETDVGCIVEVDLGGRL
jgi:hypothetical protein